MDGIFVTGTGTGVGKTTICAGLLRVASEKGEACYWKPVQTGTVMGDDTDEVKALTGLPEKHFMEPGYRLPEPSAPSIAARHLAEPISINRLASIFKENKTKLRIVEGAGGLLVPYNSNDLQVDFMKRLEIPTLIVAEDKLGTINQTLLTVRACRDSGLEVLGVILTKSAGSFGNANAEAIAHFGKVEVLETFEERQDRRATYSSVVGSARLRHLFGLAPLPN